MVNLFCFRHSRTVTVKKCDKALPCNNLTPQEPGAGRRFKKDIASVKLGAEVNPVFG